MCSEKSFDLLWRDLSDLYFEYLAGPLSRFESRIHDEDNFGPVGHEHEVEENLTDAGANIEGRHARRQIEICQQMVDYRRTKTVVPDENISAAEYENRFGKKVLNCPCAIFDLRSSIHQTCTCAQCAFFVKYAANEKESTVFFLLSFTNT